MTKDQALHSFWSQFSLPAYEENSVPLGSAVPEMPYITYENATDSIGYQMVLSASLWYRSTSWSEISAKTEEIAKKIGYGFLTIPLDKGYLWIAKGMPFARRMRDENDLMVKRMLINILVEFLTDY